MSSSWNVHQANALDVTGTSSAVDSRTPAQKAFGTAEITEAILLQQDPKDLLAHCKKDATLTKAIDASPDLKHKLYLTQLPSFEQDDDCLDVTFECNAIFFPDRLLDVSSGMRGRLVRFSGAPHILYGIAFFDRRLYDTYAREVDLSITLYEDSDENAVRQLQDAIEELPDSFLRMFATDRTTVLAVEVNIRLGPNMDSDDPPGQLWVPEGKTLGGILHWISIWKAGALRRSDVLNGFYLFMVASEGEDEHKYPGLVRMGKRHVPHSVRDAALKEREAKAQTKSKQQIT